MDVLCSEAASVHSRNLKWRSTTIRRAFTLLYLDCFPDTLYFPANKNITSISLVVFADLVSVIRHSYRTRRRLPRALLSTHYFQLWRQNEAERVVTNLAQVDSSIEPDVSKGHGSLPEGSSTASARRI